MSAEEEVLRALLNDDPDTAKDLLNDFLPGELWQLGGAAHHLWELTREVRTRKGRERKLRERGTG